MTRLTKTGTQESYERLHHPNGAHRATARSANGSDLDHFEQAIRPHLAEHEARIDECGAAFAHTPDRDIDPGPDCAFCGARIDAANGGRSVNVKRLLGAFDAVGAAVAAPPPRKATEPGVQRPAKLSPAFGLAVDLVRHFRHEGQTSLDIWQQWSDEFAAYIGDEVAEHMSTYLPDPAGPLEIAAEMRLPDSAMLTGPIRREITEPTTDLEHLARQWVELAMTRIVRRYYLDLTERKEAGQ